jgi:hypothetical protein
MKFAPIFRKIFKRIDLVVFLVIALVLVRVSYKQKLWLDKDRVIAHDVIQYYQYLPATFIYKDITLQFLDEGNYPEDVKMWGQQLPSGNKAGKMTLGMSVMYSPFFVTAHLLAEPLGYDATGYTPPYRFALILSSLFFSITGLYLLLLLLRKYFEPVIVAVTLVIIGLGTNLYFYVTLEPTMTHAYSFFLFTLFIFLIDRWLRKPDWKTSVFLGMVSGLIVIVRVNNGIILMLFLLWNVGSWKMFKERIQFLLRHIPRLGIVILFFAIMLSPQVFYWKYVTGSWIYYSYGEEGFFFLEPKYIDGLFSYRKGWFVYTPLMALSVPGFVLLYRENKKLFFPVAIFTLANTWIILSWWCWWYGGSFGQRSMIESYALLAFPIAYLANRIRRFNMPAFIIFLLIVGTLSAYNIFQTRQYYFGSIHWDSMSRKAYWETFLKWKPTPEFYEYLEPPDYQAALKGDR